MRQEIQMRLLFIMHACCMWKLFLFLATHLQVVRAVRGAVRGAVLLSLIRNDKRLCRAHSHIEHCLGTCKFFRAVLNVQNFNSYINQFNKNKKKKKREEIFKSIDRLIVAANECSRAIYALPLKDQQCCNKQEKLHFISFVCDRQ